MYKARINAWNLNKNFKSGDVEQLLRTSTIEELQNAVENGSDSSVTLKGKTMSRSLVHKHLRRIRLSEVSADLKASFLPWPQADSGIIASPTTLQDGGRRAPRIHHAAQTEVHSPLPFHLQRSTPAAPAAQEVFRGSQISDSYEVRSICPSDVIDEPLTAGESSDDEDKEQSDPRSKRQKITTSTVAMKLLACPFYKHHPGRYNPRNEDIDLAMRYRTCAGPGWESVSRLRYLVCLACRFTH
jgi:hypothetical protein